MRPGGTEPSTLTDEKDHNDFPSILQIIFTYFLLFLFEIITVSVYFHILGTHWYIICWKKIV